MSDMRGTLKKLTTFREVTWNLAPAYIEADREGRILKGRGYDGLIESLGYKIDDFDDVYSLLKTMGSDKESIDMVYEAINEISSAEDYVHMTNKEFDFDLNGYHYHLTIFRKKDLARKRLQQQENFSTGQRAFLQVMALSNWR